MSSEDPTTFAPNFMMHLLGFMASQQESMLVAAWSIFRNWMFLEKMPGRLLATKEHLKTAFGALIRLAQATPAMAIQLLLMYYGFMRNPELGICVPCGSEARRKRVKDLLAPMLITQRAPIADMQERLAALSTRPELAKYAAEMEILASFRGKRGSVRRSNSRPLLR
jgi:hypothetical protein